jgi:hypothetical protein
MPQVQLPVAPHPRGTSSSLRPSPSKSIACAPSHHCPLHHPSRRLRSLRIKARNFGVAENAGGLHSPPKRTRGGCLRCEMGSPDAATLVARATTVKRITADLTVFISPITSNPTPRVTRRRRNTERNHAKSASAAQNSRVMQGSTQKPSVAFFL